MRKCIKGFSLVEVLVASLVTMLGVTGYVTLQTEYVIADKNINLRYHAQLLAQQKLNDLSFFQQLSGEKGRKAYHDILSNKGGDMIAGLTSIRLSDNKSDVQAYNLSWQVEDWYYMDTNFDQLADTWKAKGTLSKSTITRPVSDLKSVKVEISWLDTKGNPQYLSMNSNIVSISPRSSFQLAYRDISVFASL